MRALPHYLAWMFGLAEAETQTTAAERDCLAHHAAGRRALVEIGVWHGVTTKRLRASMSGDGCLTAVDPFQPGRLGFSLAERIARREVDTIRNGRVRWIRDTGSAAARGHGMVDFIFIDGDHSEAGLLADWTAWHPLVLPGGIVALHDSRSTPTRQIDDAGSVIVTRRDIVPDPRFEVVACVDSLTVLRRRST